MHVKPLPVIAALHMGAASVLAAPLLTQPPASMSGNALEDGPVTWALAYIWETWMNLSWLQIGPILFFFF